MSAHKQRQSTYRAPEDVYKMLDELSTANLRSQSQMINVLVIEAYNRMKKEQRNDAAAA